MRSFKDLIHLLLAIFFAAAVPAWAGTVAPLKASDAVTLSDIRSFSNFSTAVHSPLAAGKVIEVKTPVSCNNLTVPEDVVVKVFHGGSINNNGRLIISGKFEAPPVHVFKGTGDVIFGVYSIEGTYPEWWGAVTGRNRQSFRDANTAAILKAWAAVVGKGTLFIKNTYEVSGTLSFGTTVQLDQRSAIIGNSDEKSQIISFAAGTAIDCVGMRFLTLSGFNLHSTTAQIGILMGRSGAADGAFNSLEHIRINGSYSKGAIVTIAAEIIRGNDCKFWNSYPGAAVYASSTGNGTIGAVSGFAPMTTSSNTDIRWTNCMFWSQGAGQNTLWFENGFNGSFDNCLIIAENPDATNKHVRFVANNGNVFAGKINFNSCLFEGGYLTVFYFDYLDHQAPYYYFYNISIKNSTFTIFSAGNKLFDYKDISKTQWIFCDWDSNNVSSEAGDHLINAPGMQGCTINAPSFDFRGNLNVQQCTITAMHVTWNAGAAALQSIIRDFNTLTFGRALSVAGATPASYTPDLKQRFILGPVTAFSESPATGEIQTVESGYGKGFPGAATVSGRAQPAFYNGADWQALGALPGTPASAAAPGKPGTIVYDDNYAYICIAANRWIRLQKAPWP